MGTAIKHPVSCRPG